MSKKNVLIVINQLHSGGAEKVVASLSRDLAPLYNIRIAIFNDLEEIGYPIHGQLIKINLPYSSTAKSNSTWARAIRFYLLIRQLRKIKVKFKIDVAISFLEASNIVNILSRKQEKVYVSVRSNLSEEIGRNKQVSIYRKFVKKLYNRADGVVAPSRSLSEDLIQNFGVEQSKIFEIQNYLNMDQIASQQEERLAYSQYDVIFRHPVLINVGRLHPAKGQAFLLRVLREVKKTHPDVKLVILGEGDLKGAILQGCEELGLRAATSDKLLKEGADEVGNFDVYLLGMQKNPYQFLKKGTIFLFPSLYEGFPNALLEAMAVGLPVVAADCNSGPREILAPETGLKEKANSVEITKYGFLMPPVSKDNMYDFTAGNEVEGTSVWAKVIEDLLTDTKMLQHYSEQAKGRAKDYSKSVIIEKWNALVSR